jgi:hypothetical protein
MRRASILALVLTLAIAGVATAAHQPIVPRHAKQFVPVTGDWEGTVDGFPASFELLYHPSFATKYHLAPYAFENLIMFEPDSCPVASYQYYENMVSQAATSGISAGGSFRLGSDGWPGGLIGARTAKLSAVAQSGSKCRLKLHWTMHPARRRAVQDGEWKLHFSDGASNTFSVASGGRLASGVTVPDAVTKCGASSGGGADLFIGTGGSGSYLDPQSLGLQMTFHDRTATGKMSFPGTQCAPVGLSAKLVKSRP